MAKENLPRLTETRVRKLASEQSFERGQRYYRDAAIIEPVRQGLELRAQCAGSEYEPYEVSTTLAKTGVADLSCTCPYDRGGACKHVVALLLTYVHQPQTFRVIPPLKAMLSDRSKEELIDLIDEMVKRDPKMMAAVELASAAPRPGKAMNVSAYRSQGRRAMRSESPRMIEKELKALRDGAARLVKAGDWLNAGAIYHAALDEAVLGYDDLVHQLDEDGDICVVMDELAQGLGKCLEKSQADAKTRWGWIETMLEAGLKDIALGGIDLAPSASEAVLKLANDEEWARIDARLRDEISTSRDWRRESLVGFLTEGLEQRKRADEADELVRDLGTPEQRTFLLIGENKIAEAIKEVKKIIIGKPGLVVQFADALVQTGAKKEAVTLVLESGSDRWMNRDWLAKYYRKHGTPQEAVEAQQKVFLGSPSVEAFKILRDIARKAGHWEEVRERALDELERKQDVGALIGIALHEGDVPRALGLLTRLVGGRTDYKLEVARAAEKDHPQAAMTLYQELAERAIDQRSRSSYQQAAEYLKRAKKLSVRINAQAIWEAHLQTLRTRYTSLRALQEELRKARLSW